MEGNSIDHDDDDGCDTDEWDSSDNNDDSPSKGQQTEYSQNTQPVVRLNSKLSDYFTVNPCHV